MFGIGGGELFVIALVAVLVFGPRRIPEVARAIKRGYRELLVLRQNIDDTVDDLRSEMDLNLDDDEDLAGRSRRATPQEESARRRAEQAAAAEEDTDENDTASAAEEEAPTEPDADATEDPAEERRRFTEQGLPVPPRLMPKVPVAGFDDYLAPPAYDPGQQDTDSTGGEEAP
jgi:sec-independent protein translocase protein TatB